MQKEDIHFLEDCFNSTGFILEALSSKIRQNIILELAKHYPEGLRIGDIHKEKCITRPTMSHHMKLLCKANLVHYYSKGTKNYYYLAMDIDKLSKLIRLFEQLEEFSGEKHNASN